jgi:hypothetical protein
MKSIRSYPPLRFRAQSELYWEASECCLINADLLARYPGIETQIFVNPFVRVAYDLGTWRWQPRLQWFERMFVPLQYFVNLANVKPEFNPRRSEIVGRPNVQRQWVYDRADLNGETMRNLPANALAKEDLTGSWESVKGIAAPGGFCGQRRLFVMKTNLQKANMGSTGKNWEWGPFPDNNWREVSA